MGGDKRCAICNVGCANCTCYQRGYGGAIIAAKKVEVDYVVVVVVRIARGSGRMRRSRRSAAASHGITAKKLCFGKQTSLVVRVRRNMLQQP